MVLHIARYIVYFVMQVSSGTFQADVDLPKKVLNELNCSCLPYHKHLINRSSLVGRVGGNLGRVYRPHCLQSLCTNNLGQVYPIQLPPVRLVRAKYNTSF